MRLVCYGAFTNRTSNADLQNSILWYNTPIINSISDNPCLHLQFWNLVCLQDLKMEYNHQSIQDEIWMVLYLFLFSNFN